jgi:hypothetical protein
MKNGDSVSVKPCDRNILRTLELISEMIELANIGDIDREDTGCGILYGMLRDSAYKIKKLAEKEKENHIKKGWWTQYHE